MPTLEDRADKYAGDLRTCGGQPYSPRFHRRVAVAWLAGYRGEDRPRLETNFDKPLWSAWQDGIDAYDAEEKRP